MIYGMSMVRLGRLADARAALEFALTGNPTSTTLRLALGEATLAAGDDEACERVLESLPADSVGAVELRAALRRARRELPTNDALALLTTSHRMNPGQWEPAIQLLLELGRPEDAERLRQRQPANTPPEMARMVAARTATARRDAAAAIPAWHKVLAKDASFVNEAFFAMLDLDAFDEASSIAHDVRATTGSPHLLGLLALYSGQPQAASELLAPAEPSEERRVALAAIALLEGRPEEAHEALKPVERSPSAELLYVESLRRSGRVDEAAEAFRAVSPRARAQVAAAPLVQVAVYASQGTLDAETTELWQRLRGDFPDLAGVDDPVAFAEAALRSLSGNWSEKATRAHGSETRRQVVSRPVRDRAAALHGALRGLPTATILAEYEALEAEYGPHPLIATYGAELLLWWGDFTRAEAWLRRALDLRERTRWAYIGIATLQNATGQPHAALDTLERQRELVSPLPNSLACSAEAHLRLGDAARAKADYEAALVAHPARMSAWLGLAAAQFELGEDHQLALARVAKLTPTFYRQWQREVPARTEREKVMHALTMLQGNRGSSIITWRTQDGTFHGENVAG